MEGKILIVHRNEMVLDVIQEMLQNVGFATTLTTDGHQALAKALSEHFNLVIIDRNLEGAIDGIKLVERLRRYGVRAPIIGTSPEETWQSSTGGATDEIDRFLPAPFGYGDLIRAAETLLDRSLSPPIPREPDPVEELPTVAAPPIPAPREPKEAAVQAVRPPVKVQPPKPVIRKWQPPAIENRTGPARILVVDTDDGDRRRTVKLLSGENRQITDIRNGQDAYEATMLNDYDLIVSDLWLVGMDGFEMIDAMRKSGVTSPIAVLTSYVTREMVAELAAAKVCKIFIKPVKPETIAGFVAETVRSA